MSATRIEAVLQAAISEGVLPDAARLPAQDIRPWPVVLLTALGAWLAALPLLGVVGLLFGDLIQRSAGPYLVGVLVLSAAIVVLRSRSVPLFVEQLAVPALLVGAGALGFGLFRDLQGQAAASTLALVAVGLGLGIARPWLRVLLGAAAALLLTFAWLPEDDSGSHPVNVLLWCAWHLNLTLWLAVGWARRRWLGNGARARAAAAIESLSAGWLLATLAGLAGWSGMTFLLGGSLGGDLSGTVTRSIPGSDKPWLQAVSMMLALSAALWAARRWSTLRNPCNAGVAGVLVALAWFMPAFGAVLLALASCVTTARWRQAIAASMAAAWIVGAFYYQLDWPLSIKAVVLVAAGALLGGLAWLDSRSRSNGDMSPSTATDLPTSLGARAGIALSALAVLAVANAGIWQKEDLIAHGQPVYVEMAPVDPRSLMQGDFMRLNFRLPDAVQAGRGGLLTSERPRVVARRDVRGVATVLHLDEGAALQADELRIELTPKDGRWVLVSDAWFFSEGEGQRWAAAKYAEFRVDAKGRALLVGLRGATLDPL